MKMPSSLFLLVLTVCLLCVGCRAKPAPDAGFLDHTQLMTPDKNIPFNRIYTNAKFKDKHFTEIYVAPVNIDYVMAQNTWERATLANLNEADVRKNVELLGDYLRDAYVKAAKDDPTHRFTVVDTPGPDTLILEMAIVQLVPSKVELQALGLVPVGFVGVISSGVMMGASAVTNSEDQGKGVIAMEARTRDAATGEVVRMFTDREHPPTTLVDIKALFWWEPAKPICDAWAKEFIELETSPPGTVIKNTPNFELMVF